jgi:hypothetical protein
MQNISISHYPFKSRQYYHFKLTVTKDMFLLGVWLWQQTGGFGLTLLYPAHVQNHTSLDKSKNFMQLECMLLSHKYMEMSIYTMYWYLFTMTSLIICKPVSVEITNKMKPCNRIYYSTVHWRLNMFRAAYHSSSGAVSVFAASGLHMHVVTGCSLSGNWPVPTQATGSHHMRM